MSLIERLNQLELQTGNEDYERALETTEAILKQDPNNRQALETRVVLLIRQDKISQAYTLFEKQSSLAKSLSVAYAYILYRLDKHAELRKFAESLPSPPPRGVIHALAQSEYKHEHLARAASLYESLYQDAGNEKTEVEVNISAVTAIKGFKNEHVSSQLDQYDNETYDHMFNKATYYLSQNELQKALDLLQQAKVSCQQSSGLTDAEKDEELAPILVQAAYIQYLQGEIDAASSTLNQALESKIPSRGLIRSIAVNNQIVLNEASEENRNPNDILKKIMDAENSELDTRAIGIQARPLMRNRLLVEREIGKDTRSQSSKLTSKFPSTVSSQVLAWIQAVPGQKAFTIRRNLQALLKSPKLELKPSVRLAMSLAVAQLFIDESENYDEAANILISAYGAIPEDSPFKHAPGFVSALVAGYKVKGAPGAPIVESAIEHWPDRDSSNFHGALQIIAESAWKKDVIRFLPPSNLDIPSLVASRMTANLPVSQSEVQLLPSVETLVQGIDTEDLEESGLLHISHKRSNPNASHGRPADKIKRTKRKGKTSQTFNPDVQPDPERWLPKRDRSTYRPTRKEKKNAKSTQGGASDNSTLENVEAAKQSSVKASQSSSRKKGRK